MASTTEKKFVALFDLHWGSERRGGKTRELHNPKAIDVALQFIGDFKPDEIILGGDALDCGAISHHNDRRAGRLENLRLLSDAEGLRKDVLSRLPIKAKRTFIEGNHEDWLNQMVELHPGLSGIIEANHLLKLDGWNYIPQGGLYRLGKLWFAHGDQLGGGEHVAKKAVIDWERSVRFGHHHTYQAYTKTAAPDSYGHTGVCVPCLCRKGPGYGKGKANRWIEGFNYGWVAPNGYFTDYIALITKNRARIEGKLYKG